MENNEKKSQMPGAGTPKKTMPDTSMKQKMPGASMKKTMPVPEMESKKQPADMKAPDMQAGTKKSSSTGNMPQFSMTHPTTGPGHQTKAPAAEEEELVLTPGGWRPKSKVHKLEAGHHVSGEGNRLKIIHTESGKVVADLGEIPKKDGKEPNMPKNVYVPDYKKVRAVPGSVVPDYGSGWITYSDWTNNSGQPISSFTTNWVVPPAPATDSGQTIFLFNGIQNSGFILQPVLQWGPSYAGGGNYWAVTNWYADGQGGSAVVGPSLVTVNPGDSLQGIMTLTSQSGSSFSYQSAFTNIPSATVAVTNIEELTWACETLEVYRITQCSDYPATDETTMNGIEIIVGGNTEASITWQPVNAFTECGQHCNVVSNASPGGEVDIFYSNPPPAPWSGWASLGGWIDLLTVGQNQDGRMEIFARGSDGAVWHNWQTEPNGNWSGWASLGGWIDMLTIGQNADGRLEIFARGSDGAVWHNWQTEPNGNWSGWASLGGWIDILTVGKNADGRLEIFARGGDGAVWHNWQIAPNGNWSGWASLGGWIDRLVIGQNQDGRLELFARGSDAALWHMWQTAPSNGWSGWASLGGWIDMLTVSQNADGRMEVFARGSDAALWHMWQTAPNNGWSGWASLGGWIDMLTVEQNQDGRMEVFVRGSDLAVWHLWQTAPSNGWGDWASLGGWIDRLFISHNLDGRIEVFARGGDGAVWHNWQTAPNF